MRKAIKETGLILEFAVYLAVSPLVFIVCKSLETIDVLVGDENND